MNSEIFLALEQRLKTLEPDIKYWYDFDTGQLEEVSDRPAVNFPCALVKISYNNCVDMSNEPDDQAQQVRVLIQIKLGFDIRSSTSGITPEAVRSKALSVFDTLRTTHLALQGETLLDLATPLSRNSCTDTPNRNGYKVYTAVYECTLID